MKRQVDYNGFYENILKNSFNAPFQLNKADVLENASQIPEYKPFINFLKRIWTQNSANYSFQGLFLSDYPKTCNIYFGYLDEVVNSEDEKTMLIPFYYYTNIGRLNTYDLSYDLITDKLTIETTAENKEFLTNDNVKSVFNHSIAGCGEITLFRHIITITTSAQDFILLKYISSKSLKVDSVQDLRTLCGNNFTLPVEGIHQVGPDTFSKVIKLVGTNTTLDYTTIKSDGTLQTLSALSASLNDVITVI